MFCHEFWEEKIEFKTFSNLPQDEIQEGGPAVQKKSQEIDWFMPCKFKNDDKKEMIAYYILYNMTLGPSNMFTSPDKSLQVDDALLSLKTNLDQSVLTYKAR